MKTFIVTPLCLAVAVVALSTGCSKEESPTPTANQTAEATKKAVGDVVTDVKQAAGKAVDDVKQKATDAAAAADSQVKALIDQAKSLVSEKKYSEALNVVKDKLSALKLTPEQQSMVDSLKQEIQKAMASLSGSDASKAASDLLKPKN